MDYTKLAGFVMQHLRIVATESLKCVVQTGRAISARHLSHELRRGNTPVRCYDAGVEIFKDDIPQYREGSAGDGGEAELTAWLGAEGGVLVTSEIQFRGAEADSIIFVTKDCLGYSFRSPVTRAVAGLLVITGDLGISVREMRRHWDVKLLEEGAGEDSD